MKRTETRPRKNSVKGKYCEPEYFKMVKKVLKEKLCKKRLIKETKGNLQE